MKYLLILLLLVTTVSRAQLSSDPELAINTESFTVIFNSEGTPLEDFDGAIYAHTGITIDGESWQNVIGNWGQNNVQPEFNKITENTYQLVISPSAYEFYALSTDQNIDGINMVVRSADTSIQTEDLYLELYTEGFNINISAPSDEALLTKNQEFTITTIASIESTLEIYIDDVLLTSQENTQELEVNYSFDTPGYHDITLKGYNGTETEMTTHNVYVKNQTQNKALPSGSKDGLNIQSNGDVTFVLHAPGKIDVFLIGEFNDWSYNNDHQLFQDGDRFWVTVEGLDPNYNYAYQYRVDGNIDIADPHSPVILDPWNDEDISTSTYPSLKTYPEGAEGLVSLVYVNKPSFTWTDDSFEATKNEQAVIYEMLIRDFTEEGSYQAAIDRLDYLVNLGVTAIELMPINEFEGNDSWGYNPSFYKAVDKAYGSENDLKEFINACHERGISVLFDIVLNHSFGQSPLLSLYWDSVNNRPASDNPWYNIQSNFENPDLQWGYDFNHESEDTRIFFNSVLDYWIEEFHFDGYRFDFTKGLSNTPHPQSTDPFGSAYDSDRVDILKNYTSRLWEKHGEDLMIIFEHLADNQEEKELADFGIFMWGNLNESWSQNVMGYSENSDISWGDYKQRDWQEPKLISYMESHDEERIIYKTLTFGSENGSYRTKDLPTALERLEAAQVLYLSSPGPKMIWQFGEFGYDISIDENGRTGRKPVKWDYLDDPNRSHVASTVATINGLRKNYKDLNNLNYNLQGSGLAKNLTIDGDDIDFVILANFGTDLAIIEVEFPSTGTFYEYFSGDESEINSNLQQFNLKAGEYRIYSSSPLQDPLDDGSGDNDKDGVPNTIDQCPNTPLGTEVNDQGCPIFTLPADNYTIETLGESCQGKDNGQITLTTKENNNYRVLFNGEEYDFNSTWAATNITPGTYELKITILDEEDYEQLYYLTIQEGTSLQAGAHNTLDNQDLALTQVSISSGSAPYEIYINDEFQFDSSDELIPVWGKPGDKITLKTSVECEGDVVHYIPQKSVSIYPNPVADNANISLNHPDINETKVQVFNQMGQMVKSFVLKRNENRAFDFSELKKGLYYLRFDTKLLETQRIIKK